jgi:hypothetical protein
MIRIIGKTGNGKLRKSILRYFHTPELCYRKEFPSSSTCSIQISASRFGLQSYY